MAVTPGMASRRSASAVILFARRAESMETDTPCRGHGVGVLGIAVFENSKG